MDTDYTYPIGSNGDIPYRVVIGWSDTEQSYFARIETNTLEPITVWQFEPAPTSPHPLLDILALAQIKSSEHTGIEQLEWPIDDIQALQDAPYQRLVDSAEIEHLGMLDTDYAQAPIYGNTSQTPVREFIPFNQFLDTIENVGDSARFSDGAPNEDIQQMISDSFLELKTCVSCLRTALENIPQGQTVDGVCNGTLLFTACELVRINESLYSEFSGGRLTEIAIASESAASTIEGIFTPEEISLINTLTVSLCGSKLTDFTQALERCYDPTTGLPLDCPDPASFNWADTVEDDAIGLYQQYGLSLDDAQHMVNIELTDPRYRDPEAWAFLESTAQRLRAIREQMHEGMGS